jgi:hypothetical protein
MYGKPLPIPEAESKPLQFSLWQMIVWMAGASLVLALLSQLGTLWGLALWLAAALAAAIYALLRGWYRGTALVAGLVLVVAFLSLPMGDTVTSARRSSCQNNLRHIGIALQNYHDVYKSFPPAYVADTDCRPMHSWRVLILPFLDHKALYERYDFSEPWDGPNNRLLAAEMPREYWCPSETHRQPASLHTSYVAVVGTGTMWPGERAVSMSDLADGSSNTLQVVESSGCGIHWMEPRDLHALQMAPNVNPLKGQGICSCHDRAGRGTHAHVLRADGSVTRLDNDTRPEVINAGLTIAGRETVEAP